MIKAYIITLILIMPILLLQNSKSTIKIKHRYIMYYTITMFILIIGLRDNASISFEYFRQSDESNYRRTFDSLIGTPFTISNIKAFEWLRYILDWILANTFKNSQIWVFTYALITNVLYVKAIDKYVKPFWLGIFLYITAGLYTYQINATTSILAGAILTLSIDFIVKKQFWNFLLVISIAAGFHSSAWVMLPLYFFLNRENIVKSAFWAIIIAIIFMLNFNKIANVLLPQTPYVYYLAQINSNDVYGVNIFRILVFLVIYVFVLLMRKRIENYSNYDKYFLNSIIILICINIVSVSYVYVYRFNELFLFAIIVMLPRITYSFKGMLRIILVTIILISFFMFGLQQNWNVLFRNILIS